MNIAQILALYDEEERRMIEYPGMRREATPHVVRHVDLVGKEGLVIYSDLEAANVEEIISEQIKYFEKIGQNFEWKYYEHDKPADLKSRLIAHDFEIQESEAIVVLDLENISKELLKPPSHDVRRISDLKQIGDVIAVQDDVWEEEHAWLAEHLKYQMQQAPESLSLYVVYVDGRPVASAWIRFSAGSQFASLWGGSTLPAYRQRGIYTEMLGIRAQEALQRGARFLTVDASTMSHPILEKLGFQLLTNSNPCQWRRKSGTTLNFAD